MIIYVQFVIDQVCSFWEKTIILSYSLNRLMLNLVSDIWLAQKKIWFLDTSYFVGSSHSLRNVIAELCPLFHVVLIIKTFCEISLFRF